MTEIEKDKPIPPEPKIVVEHGIPIPVGGMANPKYPFNMMEIGDSFFITDHLASVRTLIQRLQHDGTHRKFILRSDAHGWRCWRIK